MNGSLIFRSLLVALFVCAGAGLAQAQDAAPEQDAAAAPSDAETAQDAPEDQDADEQEEDEETSESEGDPDADSAEEEEDQEEAEERGEGLSGQQLQLDTPQVEDSPPETPEQDQAAAGAEDDTIEAAPEPKSPIADLASSSDESDFVPLEDIDEGVLQSITPASVYPHVDWSGSFRLRNKLKKNFDLGTQGSSAVPPPLEQFNPPNPQSRDAVDPDANMHWSTNMRLRLEPEIHITESLRLHIEADILDNVVLGTQQGGAGQLGVAGYDSSQPMIRVNEAWAELDAFFGTLRAGRMDTHWGLGMFYNDGDCLDCSVEAPLDRVSLTSRIWEFYARLTVDFPGEGVSTDPLTFAGQAYDASQVDDANQYSIALFHSPVSREDRELRAHRQHVEKRPVYQGGLQFIYRNQDGFYDSDSSSTGGLDALDQGSFVWRGMDLYIPDLWFEVLYNPEQDLLMRVSLEAMGILGSIDNATGSPVGINDSGDGVNCFDKDVRAQNKQLCTSQGSGLEREDVSTNIAEFGAALETELYLGGPLRYGLNGGFATGGEHQNWGFQSQGGDIRSSGPAALNFYRFNPNYHVDMILFREVIGTVTNAYYAKPWTQVRFWESPTSRMEIQLDAVLSGAMNPAGTPSAVVSNGQASGGKRWLGLEFDAAARYLEIGNFQAELAGGLLFPFSGLDPQVNSQRLLPYGDQPAQYGEALSSSLAWTIQAHLNWMF